MISGTFYTIGEVADKLQKNRLTIRRWIQAGKLPIIRVGHVALIREEDYDSLARELGRRTDFRNRPLTLGTEATYGTKPPLPKGG